MPIRIGVVLLEFINLICYGDNLVFLREGLILVKYFVSS